MKEKYCFLLVQTLALKVALFLAETGLCDIIGTMHGHNSPNTHIEGSKIIDFILGISTPTQTVLKSGILLLYEGIHSNYKGLYCVLNLLKVFRGEIHHILENEPK
eukprot:13063829-Ditylum_brightwellii.AAC.1